MRSAALALAFLTSLVAGQTLVIYSDDACASQVASYTSSGSSENSCVAFSPSNAMSYEIQNDDENCSSSAGYTAFSVWGTDDCSSDAYQTSCYTACTSVSSTSNGLKGYFWETVTDPVDPPRA